MNPARVAAVRALTALERGGTTLANELDRARRRIEDPRDRSLLLEIVAGTERWRSALDYMIARVSRRPLIELDAGVRATLRAAAFQMRYLDRVPTHAIVSESVEIVRHLRQHGAAGFVNAVLRALPRVPHDALPAAPRDANDREALIQYLTITQAHPEWLVTRWIDRHGADAARAWCEFNNTTPELTVRPLPPHSLDEVRAGFIAHDVTPEPARFISGAIRIRAGGLGRLPPQIRAMVLVQEEASQLVAHAVGARPDERVLDACAAPGGKTIVIGSLMEGRGMLVAADRRPARVALLRTILAQSSADARVLTLDATRPLPFGAVFDRVLIDAPCSGLGTIRRDPDVKWSRSPDDLRRFAGVQLQMLRQAADVVRPGGSLVYATCSSEPDENDAVVDAFLNERGDFREAAVALAGVRDADRLVDPRGRLRTLPFSAGLDGFFAARLVRRNQP